MRWLHDRGLLKGPTIDYGCGRRTWYDLDGWDPHWRPTPAPEQDHYQTAVCCYVLNVVDEEEVQSVLDGLMACVKPGGTAYVAVRRDLPTSGKKGRGVWQHYVTLDAPWKSILSNSSFELYERVREPSGP